MVYKSDLIKLDVNDTPHKISIDMKYVIHGQELNSKTSCLNFYLNHSLLKSQRCTTSNEYPSHFNAVKNFLIWSPINDLSLMNDQMKNYCNTKFRIYTSFVVMTFKT